MPVTCGEQVQMIHLLATIGQKADSAMLPHHNMAWHGTAQHHALSAQCSAAQNAVSMPSAQCSAAQDGQRGTTRHVTAQRARSF